MALNKRRLERSQRSSRGGGGGTFWRPQDGRSIVRLFTFKHTVSKEDFVRGLYRETDQVKVDGEYDELERCVWRHFTDDGIVNCVGKKDCEHCAEADRLMRSSDKTDQKAGRQLMARKVFYVNLVDVNNTQAGMQIGALPSTVFNTMLNHILDPEFGEGVLGLSGRDFIIDRDKSADPSSMYNVRLRDESKSVTLSKDVLSGVKDLFVHPAMDAGFVSSSSDDATTETSKSQRDSGIKGATNATSKPAPAEDDNEFEDKGSGGGDDDDKAPWEKGGTASRKKTTSPPEDDKYGWIVDGAAVEFEDAGSTIEGVVDSVNSKKKTASIKDSDGDIYDDVPFNELVQVRKSGSRKRK